MSFNTGLLFRAQDVRKLENLAFEKLNLNEDILMQRAGLAAFNALKKKWPNAKKVVVVCGGGNNAGDGYVLAYLARKAGLNVEILHVSSAKKLSNAANVANKKCKKLKIKFSEFNASKLIGCDVIVDALLGIGLKGNVRTDFSVAIAAINVANIPVLAIDLPSGIDADTGNVLGNAIRANLTVTFIVPKIGLYLGQARDNVGDIVCDNLGIDVTQFAQVSPCAQVLNFNSTIVKLPIRRRNAHKGDFGHVLVVGGDSGMGGAAYMAAQAAARAGSGLVSLATRPEHVAIINVARPEIMTHGIKTAAQLSLLLKKCDVVVLGPGLGQSAWGKMVYKTVLAVNKPLVLDADGLNILARNKKIFRRNNWVLTPHPGEAARLLKTTTKNIQNNRFKSVVELQKKFGGLVVLKGAGTLIASGAKALSLCDVGNPGMASGGMGDVLSGIIAGLIAQHLDLSAAAELGVLVHALAGDLVATEIGERGILALDLLPVVRKILNLKGSNAS